MGAIEDAKKAREEAKKAAAQTQQPVPVVAPSAPARPALAPTAARPAIVPTPVPSPPRRRGLPDDIFLVPPEEAPAPQRDVLDVALSRGRETDIFNQSVASLPAPTPEPLIDPDVRGPSAVGAARREDIRLEAERQAKRERALNESATNQIVRAEADRILAQQGVSELVRASNQSASTYISARKNQLMARGGLSQKDAKQQALDELAVLRTVGVWSAPLLLSYGEGDYLSAMAPRVEILGVRPSGIGAKGSTVGNLNDKYIFRMQRPGEYAIDLISMPVYFAQATGIPEEAARYWFGTRADNPPRVTGPEAVASRQTFSDVMGRTGPESLAGQALAATLGVAGDVLMPDPLTIGRAGLSAVRAAPAPSAVYEAARSAVTSPVQTARRVVDAIPPVSSIRRAVDAIPPVSSIRREASVEDAAFRAAQDSHAQAERARSAQALDNAAARLADESVSVAARVDNAMAAIDDLPLLRPVVSRSAARGAMNRLVEAGVSQDVLDAVKAGLPDKATPGGAVAESGVFRSRTGVLPATGDAARNPSALINNAVARNLPREGIAAIEQALLESTSEALKEASRIAKSVPFEEAPTMLSAAARVRRESVDAVSRAAAARGELSVGRAEAAEILRTPGINDAVATNQKAFERFAREGKASLNELARMDAAIEATRATVPVAGVMPTPRVFPSASPVGGRLAAALSEAKGAAKAVYSAGKSTLFGVDMIDDYARTMGLGAPAREGVIRAQRGMEHAAKVVSEQTITDIASAKAALDKIPALGPMDGALTRVTADNVARAIHSPEKIADVLDEIVPGSKAYARERTTRLVIEDVPILDRLPPGRATPEQIKQVAIWVGAHGGAAPALLEMFGAGVLLAPEEARALSDIDEAAQIVIGRTPPRRIAASVRPQALSALRVSGDVGSLADGSVLRGLFDGVDNRDLNALYDGVWVPKVVREKLADAAMRNLPPKDVYGPVATDALRFLRTLWSRSVTRGTLATRPGYLLNNTFGNIEQIAQTFGWVPALEYAIRAELTPLLATIGVGAADLAGVVAGPAAAAAVSAAAAASPEVARAVAAAAPAVAAAAPVLRAAARGTGLGKAAVEALINWIPAQGGKAAEAVRGLLGAGSMRVGISKIMDAAEGSVVLNGRVYSYRDLYQEAVRGGVFDSFEVSDVIAELGQLPEWSSLKGAAKGLVSLPSKGVEHLAQTIATRQRVGLYATLIDNGLTPKQAADGVVRALYDYRYSLSEGEKKILGWVFPFWAYQKNSNIQVAASVMSPRGMYRLGGIVRGQRAVVTTANNFTRDYDKNGVADGRMTLDDKKAYARVVALLNENGITDPRDVNGYIMMWDELTSQSLFSNMKPEDKEKLTADVKKVQVFTDPLAWKARVPTNVDPSRVIRIPRSGAEEALGIAAPMSSAGGTINYAAGLMSVAASLLPGAWGGEVEETLRQEIFDPSRMPLVSAAFGNRTERIDDSVYQLIQANGYSGVPFADPVVEITRIDGKEQPVRSWYVRDPATIAMLDVTGLSSLNNLVRRIRSSSSALGVHTKDDALENPTNAALAASVAAGLRLVPIYPVQSRGFAQANARENSAVTLTAAEEIATSPITAAEEIPSLPIGE